MIAHSLRSGAFENHGRFFPGYVQAAGTTNVAGRKRVRVFVTHSGAVGASPVFSRAEAFYNARHAEHGLNPRPGSTAAETLRNYLQDLGFPVRNPDDALDDVSAASLLSHIQPHNHVIR